MNIKRIRTKRDHEAVLGEIERLMTAKRHTPDGDRLDTLTKLVLITNEAQLVSQWGPHTGIA